MKIKFFLGLFFIITTLFIKVNLVHAGPNEADLCLVSGSTDCSTTSGGVGSQNFGTVVNPTKIMWSSAVSNAAPYALNLRSSPAIAGWTGTVAGKSKSLNLPGLAPGTYNVGADLCLGNPGGWNGDPNTLAPGCYVKNDITFTILPPVNTTWSCVAPVPSTAQNVLTWGAVSPTPIWYSVTRSDTGPGSFVQVNATSCTDKAGGTCSFGPLLDNTSYTYTIVPYSAPSVIIPDNTMTTTVSNTCSATINVSEPGVTGGTWNITPENKTGPSNTVRPVTGGTLYTVTSTSLPAGQASATVSPSSINASPGGTYPSAITYSSPPPPPHSPPAVNAGTDQTIVSPAVSTTLTGTATYNAPPAGSISSYQWTKTGGPAGPTITSPNSATTTITGIASNSTYTFHLVATDSQGSTGSDDVFVSKVSSAMVDLQGSNASPFLYDGNTSSSIASATVGQLVFFAATITNPTSFATGTTFPYFFRVANATNGGGTITGLPSQTSPAMGITTTNVVTLLDPPAYTFSAGQCAGGVCSFQMCADQSSFGSGGVVTEANELNNCSPWHDVTVNPAAAPSIDLIADPAAPATASFGTPQAFTSLIHNTGTSSTVASFNNFFQVANAANGGGTVTDISPAVFMSAIAAGGSRISTSPTYSFPSLGTYSVRACADKSNSASMGTITETNENNNCGAWTDVTVGNPITVNVVGRLHNAASYSPGPLIVPNGSTVDVSWTAVGATTCTASGAIVGTWPYPATNNLPNLGPIGPSNPPPFIMTCSNGSSNGSGQVVFTIGAGPYPDLTASAPTPSVATVGVAATLTSTITNNGPAATGASFNNFFQVADDVGGAGNIIDRPSSAMAALAANGGNANTTNSYTFPSAGTYSIRACADKSNRGSLGTITESDEGNNCSTWTDVTVSNSPQPDLTAGITSPATATVNVARTFSATITNSGNASTGTSFTNLFQVDDDSNHATIFDTATFSLPTLAASTSASPTPSVSYTFPSTGTWYVRMCADQNSAGVGTITESNEANNCGASWTTVTVSPASTPISATCTSNPLSIGQLNQPVTWTITNIAGGTGPYTIVWSGTDIPTSPAPTCTTLSPSCNPYTITYTTAGQKTALATLTDSLGAQGMCTDSTGIGGPTGGKIRISKIPKVIEN